MIILKWIFKTVVEGVNCGSSDPGYGVVAEVCELPYSTK
jgi:hypothetical protein